MMTEDERLWLHSFWGRVALMIIAVVVLSYALTYGQDGNIRDAWVVGEEIGDPAHRYPTTIDTVWVCPCGDDPVQRIDTTWGEKVPVWLTPEQLNELQKLLRERAIWDSGDIVDSFIFDIDTTKIYDLLKADVIAVDTADWQKDPGRLF
jgi:hypothetical protein